MSTRPCSPPGSHSTPDRGRESSRPSASRLYAGWRTVYGERRSEMAEGITSEIGAPISFAQRAQVALPYIMMKAFCDLAEAYPWREARPGLYGSDVHIRREPVGVAA